MSSQEYVEQEGSAYRSWDTGLFDCCVDGRVCAKSMFCGCCLSAFLLAVLEGRSCGPMDAVRFLFGGCYYMVKARTKLRKKYGIAGSLGSDILTMWLCTVCGIAQQTRQFEAMSGQPLGMKMEYDAKT